MCGILGYVGSDVAEPILLTCLENISYRGYDSCGVTVLEGAAIVTTRSVGTVDNLVEALRNHQTAAQVGIAHTRWATHGEPSQANAHPHVDCAESLAVVHNGIIENYAALRRLLEERGHHFRSETDTEVIPHLIEQELGTGLGLVEAVRAAARQLAGAFAFIVVSESHPDQIIGVRYDCPLVVGVGESATLLSSDVAAILDLCQEFVVLENEQVVLATQSGFEVTTFAGELVRTVPTRVDWTVQQARKGGYEHFLIKEINEQPLAVRDTLRERLADNGVVTLGELEASLTGSIDRIVLLGCGTAAYACAFGRLVIEELAGIPTQAEIGSEYRYGRNHLSANTVFVAVSQSGETADTIASLRMATSSGARTIGIVNVVGSTVEREVGSTLHTRAGPEMAVPSTKAFVTQLIALELLALLLAQRAGAGNNGRRVGISLLNVPAMIDLVLAEHQVIQRIATKYFRQPNWFVIGRGLDEPLAREGALKLKEVSYIHAEAFPAGELKHGPISLVEPGMPVLAIATQPSVYLKMASNIHEVQARRAAVILVTTDRDTELSDLATDVITIPSVDPLIDPIISAVALQLLAYYAGVLRGADVDRPRNLAKSVTVE